MWGGGIWFASAYKLEILSWPFYPTGYLRHNIPAWIYFIFIILMAAFIIAMSVSCNSRKVNVKMRVIFTAMAVLLQAYFLYAPNFFFDNLGKLYHMDAYTNSIINALEWTPYESYSTSIYGHYGIFLVIPIKILHALGMNIWLSVTIAIALLGAFIFLLEYWILNGLIKNDAIYIFSVMANMIVSVQIYYNQYYQMMPHRYVPQIMILAGCFLTIKHMEKKWLRIVMWIVAGAGIIWNIETGMVSAGIWTLCSIYLNAKSVGKYKIANIAKNFLLLAIIFLGAYGFINLYNLCVGGGIISVGTFIYPMGSSTYSIEHLETILQMPLAGYFLVILLMLETIGVFWRDILNIRLDIYALMAVLSAIMGYGVFTYYINRAVTSNASIVCFEVVLLIAMICDNGISNGVYRWNRVKDISLPKTVMFFSIVVLASMALSSVSSVGSTLQTRNGTVYQKESIDTFIAELAQRVPDSAVAFGVGTAQVFSYMDRCTGIYISDWEDLDQSMDGGKSVVNQDALDYLNQQLCQNNYEYIFVNASQERYIPEEYEEIDNFTYAGFVFKLFIQTSHLNK